MPEDKDLPAVGYEESSESEIRTARSSSRGRQRRSRQSVFQYIAVLFAAAFVLLLLTYLMERRQYEQQQEEHQAQINNLQQNISSVQSLKKLMEENEGLKARVAELEDALQKEQETGLALSTELDGVTDTLSHTENVFQWTKQAMDLFWQIDEAYVRGKNKLCRELIARIESAETEPAAGPLKDYLPAESTTDTDRFSPRDRYLEIYDKLS